MNNILRNSLFGISFLLFNTVLLSAQTDSLEIPKSEILPFAEQMPEFPGGAEALYYYLSGQIKYPIKCAEKGVSGTVIIKFIVDTVGTLRHIQILQSVAPEIDAEAIRVVESMNHLQKRWQPGRHEGRAVNVEFILPIVFTLR